MHAVDHGPSYDMRMTAQKPLPSDDFLAFLEGLTEHIPLPSQSEDSNLQNNNAVPAVVQADPVPASKRTRKRNISGTKVLEAQLLEKESQLKELLIDNVYLVERNKMISSLLERKEEHAAKLQQMRDGSLSYNPFAIWQTTVAEYQDICKPAWFGARLADNGEKCAVLLAGMSRLLAQHPGLASSNAWEWAEFGNEAEVHLPITFKEGSIEDQQLQALKELVIYVHDLRSAYYHGFLLCPKALWVDGAHFQLFQLDNVTTWEAFAQARASKSNASAASPASDAHWSKVIEQCKLSDLQRLGAFVLWDLITSAKKSVTARRTALFQALTQLRQTSTQSSSMLPATAKPAVWVDSDVLDQEQSLLRQVEVVNEREKDLFHLVGDSFLFHLLSPVQVAVLTVVGFPYIADVIALSRAAAMECTQEVMTRLAEQSMAAGS